MSQPTAPPASTSSLNPGDTLAGKYQIERIIGPGSMGIVMAARHIHLDEHVAIKIMLPDAVSQGEHIAHRQRVGPISRRCLGGSFRRPSRARARGA
jgi:serine/threonine-protein kinase